MRSSNESVMSSLPQTTLTQEEFVEEWWNAKQVVEAICTRTSHLLSLIQPSIHSESYRLMIFDFAVSILTKAVPDISIVPYGSLAIKTYLPDSDIDICVMTPMSGAGEDDTITRVFDALHSAASRDGQDGPGFTITHITPIYAAVRIIKCVIGGIGIDIVFDQPGGLVTSLFIEHIDRLVGHHRLKRTLVLVKAWCCYEARILGSHHSMLSSYAIRVMVTFILLHCPTLRSPVQGLLGFLGYFSHFDWDHYAVSIKGPIPILELDSQPAETIYERAPFPEAFPALPALAERHTRLRAVLEGTAEQAPRRFESRVMNIIDPLRPSNNLGRSVSKAARFRIRRALRTGYLATASLLGAASDGDLTRPMALSELDMIFLNTWTIFASPSRPDEPQMAKAGEESPRSGHVPRPNPDAGPEILDGHLAAMEDGVALIVEDKRSEGGRSSHVLRSIFGKADPLVRAPLPPPSRPRGGHRRSQSMDELKLSPSGVDS